MFKETATFYIVEKETVEWVCNIVYINGYAWDKHTYNDFSQFLPSNPYTRKRHLYKYVPTTLNMFSIVFWFHIYVYIYTKTSPPTIYVSILNPITINKNYHMQIIIGNVDGFIVQMKQETTDDADNACKLTLRTLISI